MNKPTKKASPAGDRPSWLKVRYNNSNEFHEVEALIKKLNLTTVCTEARCPNLHECWGSEKTATFMIMGDICTRRCMFCSVEKGKPGFLDPNEPMNVAKAVKLLDLKHCVITQVNRDDLPDEGAEHFAKTIAAIRQEQPGCQVEILISDLEGNWDALETILDARPDILSHNTECVPHLYKRVRPFAIYERTLELLERSSRAVGSRIKATKTGIMVGLGETQEQVYEMLDDLRAAKVDIFNVGQYLQPTPKHLAIQKYYSPDEFKEIYDVAMGRGFVYVESGPLVRSSYHAGRAATKVDALLKERAAQFAPASSDEFGAGL